MLIYYIGILSCWLSGWALLSYTVENDWADEGEVWLSTGGCVDNACVDMVCVNSDLISGSG